ncbi:hypothetical protein MGMO_88c00420 [Methyloglobulus morosus KoM1]|uniref:Uncharacterized protein n=1 Tax=Methyloglobulus morosus KoM1 TaxID=1116472 RepID=V5BEW4_9GAMM|nr:hypothetical protein [Methyloglobulus morosus]ESS71830.1 hypothetical protein MGMO_88c00420 [Methyloglobulus morosus KoM1]
MNSRPIIFIVLSLYSTIISATEGYKCHPKQALGREDDGILRETGYTKILLNINTEFVVEKATGKIIGSKGFDNSNGLYGSPKVLDIGSKEQSYKVLTIYQPKVSVAYLEIEEFNKNSSKPFTFMDSGIIISGTCEHY